MNKWMAVLVCTCMAALTGCNPGDSSGSAKSVVVDLQAIAKALGRDVAIQQLVNQNNQNLIAQLNVAQTSLNDQWQLEMKKVGVTTIEEINTKLDEKVRNEMATKLKELQDKLKTTAGQADQFSKNFQMQLLINFRDEVRPIAQKIANRRGASVVMITAEPILSFDPAVDITADVINEMRAATPTMQVPPMAAAPTNAPTAPAVPKEAPKAPEAPKTDK